MTEETDKLRVGDVVRVKNIVGPRMVITGFDAKNPHSGMACLKWFNRRYELSSEWFHVRHLAKFSPQAERPISYRRALEMIREAAVINVAMTGMPVTMFEFIDSILSPAPTETEPDPVE